MNHTKTGGEQPQQYPVIPAHERLGVLALIKGRQANAGNILPLLNHSGYRVVRIVSQLPNEPQPHLIASYMVELDCQWIVRPKADGYVNVWTYDWQNKHDEEMVSKSIARLKS